MSTAPRRVQQIGGSSGGGVVLQGARDATAAPWYFYMLDPSDDTPWLGATEITLASLVEVAAKDSSIITLSNKLPAAAVIGQTTTPEALSKIAVLLMAREPNGQNWRRLACNTSDELLTSPKPRSAASGFSTSIAGYEEQNGINSSFALWYAFVESDADGWIFLIEKGSAAVNGEQAKGGLKFKVAAGQTIQIGAPGGGTLENFTGGLQIAFSTTQPTLTLAGVGHIRITAKGE